MNGDSAGPTIERDDDDDEAMVTDLDRDVIDLDRLAERALRKALDGTDAAADCSATPMLCAGNERLSSNVPEREQLS
jgi:hypothetical protein